MSLSTLTTSREDFRRVVAAVAERAQAILPQSVNGRIASAARLVLLHDVTPQKDGSILVGSSSDPMRQYRLEGHTCTCQDFVHGQAPEGWCQHRIAAGIHKRVRTLLPQGPGEPDPEVTLPEEMEVFPDNDVEDPLEPPACPVEPTPPSPPPCPESLFSLTLKGTVDGADAMLTVRGQTAAEFTRNLAAIRGLLDARPQPTQAPSPVPHCPTHGAMKPSTKGTGWYCPNKTPEGTWCQGRGRP